MEGKKRCASQCRPVAWLSRDGNDTRACVSGAGSSSPAGGQWVPALPGHARDRGLAASLPTAGVRLLRGGGAPLLLHARGQGEEGQR